MIPTPDTAREQAALWNGLAGRAWVEAQEALDRLFQPFEDLLVEAVSARSIRRVLDVGCGAGATTRAIARRLGPAASCVGVDISEPMLAAARARAEREHTPVSFIAADAQVHPFEPAGFDAIVSRFGVMFFADPVAAFENLRRAATRDGALRLIVWRSPEENPFMTTAERAAAPLLPRLPVRRAETSGQFGLADRSRVACILNDAGWSGVDIQTLDVPCVLPESELTRYFTMLGPLGRVLPDVDEQTRREVVQTVRAAFEPYVFGAEVRFTAACWMIAARPSR